LGCLEWMWSVEGTRLTTSEVSDVQAQRFDCLS
jgi:hypothetical protein